MSMQHYGLRRYSFLFLWSETVPVSETWLFSPIVGIFLSLKFIFIESHFW